MTLPSAVTELTMAPHVEWSFKKSAAAPVAAIAETNRIDVSSRVQNATCA